MSGLDRDLKKVFVKTYGCQMNVYDSERMMDALATAGYAAAETAEAADLILLNTCHIRERASEKVYSELGRMRVLKSEAAEAGRSVLIGVAGCVAQAEGAEIMRRAPAVDLVVGPQSYQRLPTLVADAAAGKRSIETDFAVAQKFETLDRIATRGEEDRRSDREGRKTTYSAFLTVQEGCDKFCTFCVVPYTRGAEVSRPVEAIAAEARRLVANGVREVTLLGQNVNAWHGAGPDGSDWGLGRLLFHLAEIPGLDRLRYTTSHPRDMDDALIDAHRDLPALMPYLHLPVQSGSDRILAAMNRRHTRADYLRLVDRIRAARPDIALSCDFIVGFPGETEADFRDTLSIVDEVGYADSFSFKYSPRPGTPAAAHDDQVPEAGKSERLLRLQEAINRHRRAFNQSTAGRTAEVLFERKGKREGQIVGRSPWLLPVQVDAPEALIGTIGRVVIETLGTNSLYGRLAVPAVEAERPMEAIA